MFLLRNLGSGRLSIWQSVITTELPIRQSNCVSFDGEQARKFSINLKFKANN